MENQNATTNPQGGDLSEFRKSFSDYQKNQVKDKKKTKEEILAKYFVPRNTKEIFRILPYKSKNFYTEAFFHVVPTNAAGGFKKLNTVVYCPAHNDPKVKKYDKDGNVMLDGNGNPILVSAPCPLCERAKKLLAKQDQSIKFIKKEILTDAQKVVFEKNKAIFFEANNWEAKRFYIVRGIDRSRENNGVKFWRFKHSFKNQGTIDKLYPVLEDYIDINGVSFADVNNGTDLYITMADTVATFSKEKGKTYKSISAITARGKSPLHNDSIVARQWLEDDITWRDVFKPKVAPNTTALEFLEMIVNGTSPYWEDTDQKNKHWVFPGRPDLEEKANTRQRNLDADEEDDFQQASDLDENDARVNITNVTPSKVGTYSEDAVDITAKSKVADESLEIDETSGSSDNDYEDLPF